MFLHFRTCTLQTLENEHSPRSPAVTNTDPALGVWFCASAADGIQGPWSVIVGLFPADMGRCVAHVLLEKTMQDPTSVVTVPIVGDRNAGYAMFMWCKIYIMPMEATTTGHEAVGSLTAWTFRCAAAKVQCSFSMRYLGTGD